LNDFAGTFAFNGTSADGVVHTQQVEIASLPKTLDTVSLTNFFFGTFQVGDPSSGSNAFVQLVNNRPNAAGAAARQVLAASNLFVALAQSVLDLNSQTTFAFNLRNVGVIQQTNASQTAGSVTRVDVVNPFTNQGAVVVANGSTLQFSNGFMNALGALVGLTNGGVFTNFITASVLTNAGTIAGDGIVIPAVSNAASGVIMADTGRLLISNGIVDNVNLGTLRATNGGALFVNNSTLTNANLVDMRGGSFVLSVLGSNLVNNAAVFGYGVVDPIITNNGSITADGLGVVGRELLLTNGLVGRMNTAVLAAQDGGVLRILHDTMTNLGVINLAGGTITLDPTAGSNLVNRSTITGFGDVAAVVGNEGVVTATGGLMRLLAGFTNNPALNGPVNAGLLRALGAGAELRVETGFTNFGVIAVTNGAFTAASQLDNANLVRVVGGTATFNGDLVNRAGATIESKSGSTVNFNGDVINDGDIVIDPSTNIFGGNLTLGANGTLKAPTPDDVVMLRGNFFNNSTNRNGYDTRYGTMFLGGTAPLASFVTNSFEIAGTNRLDSLTGFDNNFAVGTLNITNHISFVNNVTNVGGLGTNEALYVDVLHLFAGASLKLSQLTIFVGTMFIEDNSSQTFGPGTIINEGNVGSYGIVNVFLDSGGQIVIIPEPSTGALIGLGFAALAGWRRRRRQASR
jgi:hypothetical protein